MEPFTIDKDGCRIMTDILVTGYIRNHMNEYNVDIPGEIIGLCCMFWFIAISDEWDNH